MLTRIVGYIATMLVGLSLLDYYDIVQVTAVPLKQLVHAIITLGETIKEKIISF